MSNNWGNGLWTKCKHGDERNNIKSGFIPETEIVITGII